jgi:hypothetical protein
MYAIVKRSGPLGHERLTVKSFRDCSAMHKFLNAGSNGVTWHEATIGHPTKAGTYAYVGGQWRNIRDIDPLMRNHV